MKKILIIGAGNMGAAIGYSLLDSNFLLPENLYISDKDPEKIKNFSKKGCKTSLDPEDFIPEVNIIILALKPQVVRGVLQDWKEKKMFFSNHIIFSLVAGVSIFELQKFSGILKIVRTMPNTPLIVKKGVIGYFFSSEISHEEKKYISDMMDCLGIKIECTDEEKMNAITALSGSGPAYFFLLLEAMSTQAENFGFSKEQARKISLYTLLGSGLLAEQSFKNNGEDFSQLRKNVTSKGGTTETALTFLEEHHFSEIFREGIKKAKKRAEEL